MTDEHGRVRSEVRAGGASRAVGLADMMARMWPAPMGAPHSAGATERFFLLPRSADPTLALPVGRRAAAAAVLRYKTPSSAKDAWRMRATSAALRVGVAARVLRWSQVEVGGDPAPDGNLTAYLSAALGRDLTPSVAVGPPRANRKPIVQLLTRDGRTVAFAKVSVDDLTADLVRGEAAALRQVAAAAPAGLEIPGVLHHATWNGLEVLVLSALDRPRRERPSAAQTTSAMTELASACGVTRTALCGSGFAARLQTSLDGLSQHADRLRATAATLVQGSTAGGSGDTVLAFGCWHGDWAPWNMARSRRALMVWDWERFETDVPLGFDALHCALQSMIRLEGRRPADATRALVLRGDELLAPFDVTREAVRLTVALYLLQIAVRYAADGQDRAGSRRGPIDEWLIPVLEEQAERLGGPAGQP
jgi:hypothetical protein